MCQISCFSNVNSKGVNINVIEDIIYDANYYKVDNLVNDNDESNNVNDYLNNSFNNKSMDATIQIRKI